MALSPLAGKLAPRAILTNIPRLISAYYTHIPDPANPASIPPNILQEWRQRPGLVLLGHVADIRTVWATAHIAV